MKAQHGYSVGTTEFGATAIIESLPEACLAYDHAFLCRYANLAAEQRTGKHRELLVGRSVWEEFPELVGTEIEWHLRRAMADRTIASFEAFSGSQAVAYPTDIGGLTLLVRPSTTESGCLPMGTADGIVQLEAAKRLALDLEEQNKSLILLRDSLIQANRDLKRCAVTLAHDLQSPLSAIEMCCLELPHLIPDHPPELAEYLVFIGRSAERIQRLIRAVMEFTHGADPMQGATR